MDRTVTEKNDVKNVFCVSVFNKNAFLTFEKFSQHFVNKKTLTTVTCQLTNYALETLGER